MNPAEVAGDQPAISCRARFVHTLKRHTCSPLKQPRMSFVVFTRPYSKPTCLWMSKTRCLHVWPP